MENETILTYKIEQFEGPLDLLLSLIQKNKVEISDIPIALICDQYMEYLGKAEEMNMDIASEFIVMASELMLIKSRMLLPKVEEEEEDPRAMLADALLKYKQAKEAAEKLLPRYAIYSGRFVKDTDEISIDKTFVADQDSISLIEAMKRVLAYADAIEKASSTTPFKPMISNPIIPVESKITGIVNRISANGGKSSLADILNDSVSLPDMIAIFLGVLELIKMGHIEIASDGNETVMNGIDTEFVIKDAKAESGKEEDKDE